MENIIEEAFARGVEHLTLYAFSTENWSRPADEVAGLMKLLTQYLGIMIERFANPTSDVYKHTNVHFIGDVSVFNLLQKKRIEEIETKSSKVEKKMHLNLAINYGGRADIVNAVNRYIKQNPGKKITEKDLSANLYTAPQPDPDVIIRTGGEMRLSNFLLWQASYSEYVSFDVLWPDFKGEHLDEAIEIFGKRTRKFGGLEK